MTSFLDENSNKEPQKIIRNNFGKVFPSAAVFCGYIFMIFGLFSLLFGSLLGIVILILGGFGVFTATGVEIDIANRQFRPYTSYFGFKSGQWKGLLNYPYLCVFKSTKKFTMFSQANVSTSYTETGFDIFLLNQSHRERVLVSIANTKEDAIAAANVLASQLKIEVVQFNPKVASRGAKK